MSTKIACSCIILGLIVGAKEKKRWTPVVFLMKVLIFFSDSIQNMIKIKLA